MKLWLLPLLLSLSACGGNTGDKILLNYEQRLARVLDTETVSKPWPAIDALAAERDLKQPLPDIRLDLRDAYATRQCNLDTLIGERNSSLGKVYSASKLLSYELRFLAQLELCLQKSWQDVALFEQLQQVYVQKQQSIMLAFDNMLLTDDTLRKELLGIKQHLLLDEQPGLSETWQALTELTLLQQFIQQQNWQAASNIDIEQQLQLLYRYNVIGKLQYSLRHTEHGLNELNAMLGQVRQSELCPGGRDTEQLQILSNVFRKFFIAQLQRYTVQLGEQQQQLWPLLQQLYLHTPLSAPLNARFSGSYQAMRAALSDHVNWWQQLNSSCPLQLTATTRDAT